MPTYTSHQKEGETNREKGESRVYRKQLGRTGLKIEDNSFLQTEGPNVGLKRSTCGLKEQARASPKF